MEVLTQQLSPTGNPRSTGQGVKGGIALDRAKHTAVLRQSRIGVAATGVQLTTPGGLRPQWAAGDKTQG